MCNLILPVALPFCVQSCFLALGSGTTHSLTMRIRVVSHFYGTGTCREAGRQASRRELQVATTERGYRGYFTVSNGTSTLLLYGTLYRES